MIKTNIQSDSLTYASSKPIHPYAQQYYDDNLVSYLLLPNLRYIGSKIYFHFKHEIKLPINEKNNYLQSIPLENLQLKSEFYYMNNKINVTITQEERNDGLKIKIEYKRKLIDNYELKKIARYIESLILNIDIDHEIFDEYHDELYEDKFIISDDIDEAEESDFEDTEESDELKNIFDDDVFSDFYEE